MPSIWTHSGRWKPPPSPVPSLENSAQALCTACGCEDPLSAANYVSVYTSLHECLQSRSIAPHETHVPQTPHRFWTAHMRTVLLQIGHLVCPSPFSRRAHGTQRKCLRGSTSGG